MRAKVAASDVLWLECIATSSNCRKPLKLDLPTAHGNIVRGRGNDLGYGKNDQDATMGNLHPSF